MSSLFKSTESASVPSSTSSPAFLSLAPSSASGAVTWFYTTAAVLGAILILEQTVYRWKKQHLPGDKWTIPIIGKFVDSTKPNLDNYKKQWASGALSALSVFNMSVFFFFLELLGVLSGVGGMTRSES